VNYDFLVFQMCFSRGPTCTARYVKGTQGGAFVTGQLYGVTGDYRLVTYFEGATCTAGAMSYDATSALCTVGLYKLNSVDRQLESAWFPPLSLPLDPS
jgi:hypothetical protein